MSDQPHYWWCKLLTRRPIGTAVGCTCGVGKTATLAPSKEGGEPLSAEDFAEAEALCELVGIKPISAPYSHNKVHNLARCYADLRQRLAEAEAERKSVITDCANVAVYAKEYLARAEAAERKLAEIQAEPVIGLTE